jgi:hypothetical protein
MPRWANVIERRIEKFSPLGARRVHAAESAATACTGADLWPIKRNQNSNLAAPGECWLLLLLLEESPLNYCDWNSRRGGTVTQRVANIFLR